MASLGDQRSAAKGRGAPRGRAYSPPEEPDGDVHACFDAVFILRQLVGDSEAAHKAIAKGADGALSCRNPDGGFGRFPGRHSDMDAVHFQFGASIRAGRFPGARRDLPDAHTLSWGHAMEPGKVY